MTIQMMFKQSVAMIAACCVSLFVLSPAFALAPSMKQAGQTLVLNGEGSRTKFGMKIYKGGLYLKNKNKSAKEIINAKEPMAIRIKVTSGLLTPSKLSAAVREGFAKATGSKTAMKAQVDSLLNVFSKGVKKGDRFELVYVPGQGVKTYKNGKLGATTKGFAFKKALFSVWLGKNPAQASLKAKMLGR